MINMHVIEGIVALRPAKSMRKRWKQYSDTLQLLVLQVSTEDRDELAQMIADRLGL